MRLGYEIMRLGVLSLHLGSLTLGEASCHEAALQRGLCEQEVDPLRPATDHA